MPGARGFREVLVMRTLIVLINQINHCDEDIKLIIVMRTLICPCDEDINLSCAYDSVVKEANVPAREGCRRAVRQLGLRSMLGFY